MGKLRAVKALQIEEEPASISASSSRRALGAVRFADGTTGRWIGAPLEVTPAEASSLPAGPDSSSIAIDVRDPSGRYLPRRVRISVPRATGSDRGDAAGALFRALPIPLYPAPTAPLHSGWAVVRVSVKRGATAAGVPHAWIRLRRASELAATDPPLAVGMADARGEALIAVSGIPITNVDGAADGGAGAGAGGAVLASEIDAVLEVYADLDASSPPDPDVIDGRRATLPTATHRVRLAAGRQISIRLALTLP